jgi:hypothetical protein
MHRSPFSFLRVLGESEAAAGYDVVGDNTARM